MAQLDMKISFRIILPWWWRVYIGAIAFFHHIGVLEIDGDAVSKFLIRHCRIERIGDRDGGPDRLR